MSRFPTSHAPLGRLVLVTLLSASLGASTACHVSQPVASVPDPGATAVLTLNDRGRVAVGDAVGPNADRIEGSVESRSDSLVVLAVRRVEYFGGAANDWNGERVTVPIAGVRGTVEKRYSRGRTYLLAGGLVAALVAFVVTRSILTGDDALVDDPGSGPPPSGSHVPIRP